MSLKGTRPVSDDMGDLHEKIAEGEYSIDVKDTRIGKLATLNKGDERTLSQKEHNELEDLLNEYEDLILELWDAYHEEDDDHLSRWRMGKVYKEQVEEDEHRDMDMLTPLLPFVNSQEYRQGYRIQLFYEIFPDQEWDTKEAPGTISELGQKTETPEKARDIYDNRMRDVDESFTRDEIRAWDDALNEIDEPDLESIVEKATDRFSPREPSAKNIKNIYRLFGETDFPADGEIESMIKETQ